MRSSGVLAPRFRPLALGFAVLAVMSGCGIFDDDEILEGERISLRADPAGAAPTVAEEAPLPEAVTNVDWTQTNGTPTHNLGHLTGPVTLSQAWSENAGTGNSRNGAITSAPIVVDGTVFTLDAEASLSAFDASTGTRRWSTSLVPEGERGQEGFGGGLAADGGNIYATTGFGEMLAVSPASGEILWRQSFGAPFRAAPAARDGIVVAVTRDNTAIAVDGANGKVRWRQRSATSDAGFLGGASPAFAGPMVVLPYGSGELVGAEALSGRRLWSAVLSGGRMGMARSSITDVSGDPVLAGPFIVAANQSGRMIAIDARNGQRVWTRSIGSSAPLWAAGDTIFLVSDTAMLMRISVRDGRTLWAKQLTAFTDPDDREGAISYSTPVLVNGHLILTDSEGSIYSYDANTGVGGEVKRISGGSATGPVVANGMIFILSDSGVLYAFR